MEYDNFLSTLQSFTRHEPFRPFTVELVSGRRLEVRHPEALIMHRKTALYADPDHDLIIFDHNGVVSFKGPSEEKAAAGGKGNGDSQP